MGRPPARDADAMTGLLRRLKAQVEAVASRATLPVGKRWRIQEDPRSGNLEAVVPSTGQRIVLGTPGGAECGATAACLGDHLGPGLLYDDNADEPRLAVAVSADAGNTLRLGDDAGLYAAGGGGGGWRIGTVLTADPAGDTVTVELGFSDQTVNGKRSPAWLYPFDVGDTVAVVPPGDTTGPYSAVWLVLGRFSTPRTFTRVQNLNIPDDGGSGEGSPVFSSLTVSGIRGFAPWNLVVGANITHPHIGDVKADLVGPSGRLYPVRNHTGGSTANWVGEVVIDASTEPASGVWKLKLSDNTPGTAGHLNSWYLTFP